MGVFYHPNARTSRDRVVCLLARRGRGGHVGATSLEIRNWNRRKPLIRLITDLSVRLTDGPVAQLYPLYARGCRRRVQNAFEVALRK